MVVARHDISLGLGQFMARPESTSDMSCRICGSAAATFARAEILSHHDVQYFRCDVCGFIQTEMPYWFDEAYSEAITKSDIGLVNRNLGLAILTQSIILAFFDHEATFLDYGGGYGLMVRLMRDFGFDFYRFDKFCANLLAQGFDSDISTQQRFELVTAFEVFEHLVDPLVDIERMLSHSDSILFSTMLLPNPPPRPTEWWYYGLEHGQHVALYSRQSLAMLARHFHLNYYTNGRTLHLLTAKKLSPALFGMMARPSIALLRGVPRQLGPWKKSLLASDYTTITGRRLR